MTPTERRRARPLPDPAPPATIPARLLVAPARAGPGTPHAGAPMTPDRAAPAFVAAARRELPRLARAIAGVPDPAARDTLAALTLYRLAYLAFVPSLGSQFLSPDALRRCRPGTPSTTLFRAVLVPLFRHRLSTASLPGNRSPIAWPADIPLLGCSLFDEQPLERSYPACDVPDGLGILLLTRLSR